MKGYHKNSTGGCFLVGAARLSVGHSNPIAHSSVVHFVVFTHRIYTFILYYIYIYIIILYSMLHMLHILRMLVCWPLQPVAHSSAIHFVVFTHRINVATFLNLLVGIKMSHYSMGTLSDFHPRPLPYTM